MAFDVMAGFVIFSYNSTRTQRMTRAGKQQISSMNVRLDNDYKVILKFLISFFSNNIIAFQMVLYLAAFVATMPIVFEGMLKIRIGYVLLVTLMTLSHMHCRRELDPPVTSLKNSQKSGISHG